MNYGKCTHSKRARKYPVVTYRTPAQWDERLQRIPDIGLRKWAGCVIYWDFSDRGIDDAGWIEFAKRYCDEISSFKLPESETAAIVERNGITPEQWQRLQKVSREGWHRIAPTAAVNTAANEIRKAEHKHLQRALRSIGYEDWKRRGEPKAGNYIRWMGRSKFEQR